MAHDRLQVRRRQPGMGVCCGGLRSDARRPVYRRGLAHLPRVLLDSAERGRAESYVAFATMYLVIGAMLRPFWFICGRILLDWPVPKWFGLRTGFFSPASQAAMAACWPDGLNLAT